MRHRWVLKELPADFREQHLKFVSEEETNAFGEEHIKRSKKHTFAIRDRHRLIK